MKTGGFSFVEKEKTEERERPGRKKEGEKEKEKREKGKKERRKEGKKERRKEGKKLCWQKGRGLRVKKSCREGEFEVRALFQRGGTFGEEKLFEDEKSGEILGKEEVG